MSVARHCKVHDLPLQFFGNRLPRIFGDRFPRLLRTAKYYVWPASFPRLLRMAGLFRAL